MYLHHKLFSNFSIIKCVASILRREFCNNGTGGVPLYVNVNMDNGEIVNTWIDALQASFSGVQVDDFIFEWIICKEIKRDMHC